MGHIQVGLRLFSLAVSQLAGYYIIGLCRWIFPKRAHWDLSEQLAFVFSICEILFVQ